MNYKERLKDFFPKQKIPLIFALVLAAGCSLWVYIDSLINSYFLITPLIFLPFIWAGFILTIPFILIAHVFRMKKENIIVILPFWFFIAGYASLWIILTIFNP